MARDRSLMNMNAPFSTPTSRGGRPGVVGGDGRAQLGDAGLQVGLGHDHPAHLVPVLETRRRSTAGPSPGSVTSRLYRRRPVTPDRLAAADSRPRERATRDPAGDLGGPALQPGHLEDPVDGVGRRRVAERRPPATAAPHGGPLGRRRRPPGRRRRSGRAGRRSRRAGRRRRPAARPVGPARGRRPGRRCRRTAGAARPAPGCARSAGRRWSGPAPAPARVGRRAPPSRAAAGRAAGGRARRACRPGRATPAPRSRLARTVSAWSSAVCPVAAPGPRAARRAARARASRFGPSATATRTARTSAPKRPRRRHHLGLVGGTRAESVVDVDGGHPAPGGRGQDQEGERVGSAAHTAHQRVPAGGNVQRASRSATAGRPASPRPAPARRPVVTPDSGRRGGADPGDPGPPGRGSPRATGATRARARRRRAAPCRPPPRRRR